MPKRVSKMIDDKEAYREILLIFSEFFKYPQIEFYREIACGDLDARLRDLGQSIGLPMIVSFKDKTGTYREMVEAYNSCFLGASTPFAPPVESVYKIWTSDQSCQAPMKNSKGYLLGDYALHIRHIIEALNLEIPPEYELIPDHLAVLLEIYAYLLGETRLEEACQFKKDHLDWLPDLYEAISALAVNQPYKYAVEKLQDIIWRN